MKDIEVKNPEDYTEFDRDEPGQLGARRSCGSRPTSRMHVTGQVLRLVGNYLCVYQPWEMGEQFLATDKEGNAEAVGPGRHRPHPQPLRLPHDQPRHRRPAPRLSADPYRVAPKKPRCTTVVSVSSSASSSSTNRRDATP